MNLDDEKDRELAKLIASGVASGGIVGGAGSLLSGAKTLGRVAKGAGVGGLLAGGLAGLAGGIGLRAMGSPEESDPSGYTKRLGAGGAIGGGLAGAGLGALLGATSKGSIIGRLTRPIKAAAMMGTGRGALSKGIGGLKGGIPAAATLGVGGAAVGGYQGADEGMQMDFLRNLSKQEQEDLLRRAYS